MIQITYDEIVRFVVPEAHNILNDTIRFGHFDCSDEYYEIYIQSELGSRLILFLKKASVAVPQINHLDVEAVLSSEGGSRIKFTLRLVSPRRTLFVDICLHRAINQASTIVNTVPGITNQFITWDSMQNSTFPDIDRAIKLLRHPLTATSAGFQNVP
jgi:hypothetical protein